MTGLRELMERAPAGTGHWLAALDFYLSAPKEIAIVGPKEDPATQSLLDTIFRRYLPNKVVVGDDRPIPPLVADPPISLLSKDPPIPPLSKGGLGGVGPHLDLPLLRDRRMVDGRPTAYVCQNFACRLPVTDPEALAAQLDG